MCRAFGVHFFGPPCTHPSKLTQSIGKPENAGPEMEEQNQEMSVRGKCRTGK